LDRAVDSQLPARILVVDDEPAIRALLAKVIERRGFEADVARDGAEAIEKIAASHYDVLLIDLMMPNVNGFELVDYISRQPHPHPAVIVITAAAESAPLRHLDGKIVHSVVHKPFDIDLVADLVEAAANSKERQSVSERNVLPFHAC
jgi:CheY-like chemotaxis protein